MPLGLVLPPETSTQRASIGVLSEAQLAILGAPLPSAAGLYMTWRCLAVACVASSVSNHPLGALTFALENRTTDTGAAAFVVQGVPCGTEPLTVQAVERPAFFALALCVGVFLGVVIDARYSPDVDFPGVFVVATVASSAGSVVSVASCNRPRLWGSVSAGYLRRYVRPALLGQIHLVMAVVVSSGGFVRVDAGFQVASAWWFGHPADVLQSV